MSSAPAKSKPTRSLRPPGLIRLALEARAPFEFASCFAAAPLLASAVRGDGHSVIVYPGFMASDTSTMPMRTLLSWLGYDTYGWDQGRNVSPTPQVFDQALEKIEQVHQKSGKKISLVGWSLGGLYARELAKKRPNLVRSVVTLGSPFIAAREATNAGMLFNYVNKDRPQVRLPEGKFHEPPPMPTTSIFSRSDGIVSWQCSVNPESALAENIEVPASHVGLGVNPFVLLAIADRLAQAEDQWQPYERKGLRRLAYPDPERFNK